MKNFGVFIFRKPKASNAIIAAYEAALQKFQEAQAAIDAAHAEQATESREKTGNFYRYMEADVLKHNCIAYLLQDYLNVLGQPFTKGETSLLLK